MPLVPLLPRLPDEDWEPDGEGMPEGIDEPEPLRPEGEGMLGELRPPERPADPLEPEEPPEDPLEEGEEVGDGMELEDC